MSMYPQSFFRATRQCASAARLLLHSAPHRHRVGTAGLCVLA